MHANPIYQLVVASILFGSFNIIARPSNYAEGRAKKRLLVSNICAKISFRSQNQTSPVLFEPSLVGPVLKGRTSHGAVLLKKKPVEGVTTFEHYIYRLFLRIARS
jgi:hypothetical protein